MYVREKPAMALYVFACGHKRVEEDCSRRLGKRQRSMVSLELGVRQHVNLVRYAAIALPAAAHTSWRTPHTYKTLGREYIYRGSSSIVVTM